MYFLGNLEVKAIHAIRGSIQNKILEFRLLLCTKVNPWPVLSVRGGAGGVAPVVRGWWAGCDARMKVTFGPVPDGQRDRQKASPKSPSCLSHPGQGSTLAESRRFTGKILFQRDTLQAIVE